MLDRGRVLRVALAHLERPFEELERLLVLAGVEVLPAEVVQERPGPVRRRPPTCSASSSPRFVQATKPSRSGAASAHMCAASPASQSSARLDRRREGALEERQRRLLVAARAAEAAALEVDADAHARVVVGDLVEQPVAFVVALAQPLHARELGQRLRTQRAEARLGRVEVVEVPERAERIAHRPVVEKCW